MTTENSLPSTLDVIRDDDSRAIAIIMGMDVALYLPTPEEGTHRMRKVADCEMHNWREQTFFEHVRRTLNLFGLGFRMGRLAAKEDA